MRTDITVRIGPDLDAAKETARYYLNISGQTDEVELDVDGNALLKISRRIPDLAQDFLGIAACVYAVDKAVSRSETADRWTRHISIEIPVEHEAEWSLVAVYLSDCIGFLTGDIWEIRFRHCEKRLVQKRPRRRRVRHNIPCGKAVCLFSGGLDSFIGAVNWLVDNQSEQLLLVGHYDRHVSGPGSDQRKLYDAILTKYPGRLALSQTQVGVHTGGVDTNFRSRSLLFVAIGCYFAEILGADTPVLIPENGPIALNFPLTPARRGSCSTRTVHPQFISGLNGILQRVGITNRILNPYSLKTKGEMVANCRDPQLLNLACQLSRSCAKSNRRSHWVNRRGALGCGTCVPCLFRRAALHTQRIDSETYGIPIEGILNLEGDAKADIVALLGFCNKGHSDREIAAGLLGNGRLPLDELGLYVDLVKRMRTEVLVWLRAKSSAYLIRKLPVC